MDIIEGSTLTEPGPDIYINLQIYDVFKHNSLERILNILICFQTTLINIFLFFHLEILNETIRQKSFTRQKTIISTIYY